VPWQTVWSNEGTRSGWTHITDTGFGGRVEELNYDPAEFGTTVALKEVFTGPPIYSPGEYNRRAAPGMWFHDGEHTVKVIPPPWKIGHDAWYDPGMAPAYINETRDKIRWLNLISGFGPLVGDQDRRPTLMFTFGVVIHEGVPICDFSLVNPSGPSEYHWNAENVFTFSEKHRIEAQLVGRNLSVFLDGRLQYEGLINEAFIGELGGFHFGAYGGFPWPDAGVPIPPGVDFPEGAFCYKANHFLAVRR
jgi:hypothetical protein